VDLQHWLGGTAWAIQPFGIMRCPVETADSVVAQAWALRHPDLPPWKHASGVHMLLPWLCSVHPFGRPNLSVCTEGVASVRGSHLSPTMESRSPLLHFYFRTGFSCFLQQNNDVLPWCGRTIGCPNWIFRKDASRL
jgi:hypothetical protein